MTELFQRALDVLAPAILNPFYRTLRGDRGARYRPEVERLNRSRAAEIRAFQLGRLQAVCARAGASPFYAERFRAAGITAPADIGWEEFARIAPLTRDDLRERGDEILVAGAHRSRLRPTATGGTTASPVPLFLDWEAVNRRQSATEAFDRWFGYRPGLRIAYLWGAERDFAHPSLRTRLEATWFKRFRFFPSSPMDDAILDRYEEELRRFRPALLQAYPTPLALLAERLLERGRTLPLPAVACTAEPLLPVQRALIERAFETRPFSWYGARECGRIATECPGHHGLHLNCYGLVVETDRDAGVERGGPLLVTDLWNTSFPILRYAIGDMGVLEDAPCPCGSELPRLVEVTGRTADVFENSRGQKIPGVAFTNRILTESREIRAMQIIQHDLRRFEVLVVRGAEFDQESAGRLKQGLDEFMGETNEVELRMVDEIPREASGKVLFCRNAMTRERTPR